MGKSRGKEDVDPRQVEEDDQVSESEEEIVVDLTTWEDASWEDASRYRRQSGALPRLADDPDYAPDAGALPHPIEEPTGFFARIRYKIGR